MAYIEGLKIICEKHDCRMMLNCSLREYTTFKIGGPCKALINVNSTECICDLVEYLNANNVKYTVIGRGSNIIVPDEGYDGIVLLLGHDFAYMSLSGNTIRCEAGALLASICVFAQQNGLSGMENLFGIPGTLGGALYMNAGAYGSEISDIAIRVIYVDNKGIAIKRDISKADFSYRHSVFMDTKDIVAEVRVSLTPDDPDAIKARMNECMEKRRSKQPLDRPSAGSTFKRPDGSYASLLIEQCGLKGMSVGGAQVSEKHSGFIINTGYASCNDVLELCSQVADIVKEKTGYSLELEPVILR